MKNILKENRKNYLFIIVFLIYAILTTDCSNNQPLIENGESQSKIFKDIVGSPELIVDVDVNDEVFIRPEPMTAMVSSLCGIS